MGLDGLDFKRIKLSEDSTAKLRLFKARTGITPNIACRLALGLSLSEKNTPSLGLYSDESGQEINRYTLLGEHDLLVMSLFIQWCYESKVSEEEYYQYFIAHINRGVELLVNRVKGIEQLYVLLSEQ